MLKPECFFIAYGFFFRSLGCFLQLLQFLKFPLLIMDLSDEAHQLHCILNLASLVYGVTHIDHESLAGIILSPDSECCLNFLAWVAELNTDQQSNTKFGSPVIYASHHCLVSSEEHLELFTVFCVEAPQQFERFLVPFVR
jgi:hypothetical protein